MSETNQSERDNQDLQELFLRREQRRFSGEFSRLGVVLGIIDAVGASYETARNDSDAALLDKIFVPSYGWTYVDGEKVKELRLAAMPSNFDKENIARFTGYFALGIVGGDGGVTPYTPMPSEKVNIVGDAAWEVDSYRSILLPDLSDSLLVIMRPGEPEVSPSNPLNLRSKDLS